MMSDAERLDWLEQHPEFLLRKDKKHWTCAKFTDYPYNAYRTVREAIDAAIDGTWNKD